MSYRRKSSRSEGGGWEGSGGGAWGRWFFLLGQKDAKSPKSSERRDVAVILDEVLNQMLVGRSFRFAQHTAIPPEADPSLGEAFFPLILISFHKRYNMNVHVVQVILEDITHPNIH